MPVHISSLPVRVHSPTAVGAEYTACYTSTELSVDESTS
jgi:hypothetical protein